LTEEQKGLITKTLANKVNSEGFLQVKSQVHRSQLENKAEVVKKLNALIEQALKKVKKRIPTKISKASKEKRLESKKSSRCINKTVKNQATKIINTRSMKHPCSIIHFVLYMAHWSFYSCLPPAKKNIVQKTFPFPRSKRS
jgi:hypothetical protein